MFGNITGIMQDYLVTKMFDNSKQSQFLVSCVGTICYFVSEIVTPLVQIILERTGVRITLLIGTIMISTGLVTSGFATTVHNNIIIIVIACRKLKSAYKLFIIVPPCCIIIMIGVAFVYFTRYLLWCWYIHDLFGMFIKIICNNGVIYSSNS